MPVSQTPRGPPVVPGRIPYFVMELIKGVSITEYCDRAKLSPRQRLELFIPVCHGVQHAHQKGLIHRDLKPSNILVALYGDRPVPKVIDFGVAKVTGPRLTDHSIFTEVGLLVGTHRIHVARAGGIEQPRYRHPERHLRTGRCALRTPHRNRTLFAQRITASSFQRNASVHQGGGSAQAEHQALPFRHFAHCRG